MSNSDFFNAAVLKSFDQPLSIEKIKFPDLGWGQVLVRIAYSSICASQLLEMSGGRGKDDHLPHLLGHEGCGFIVKIGPGVSRFKENDLVILTWIQQPGIDCDPIVYETEHGTTVNSGRVSTFSEFAVVSESRLYIAPTGISQRFLPLLGCAALTGAGMAFEIEDISKRSLVVGGGGVGTFTVLALLKDKDRAVHLIEPSPKKRDIFKKIAPKLIIYPEFEDTALLRELELEGLFDSVYVCTGDIESLQKAFSLVSFSGYMLFATHPREGELIMINPHDLIRGKKLLGSWGGGCRNPVRRDQAVELFSSLRDILPSIVSTPFALEEINDAIEMARLGHVNRVLLEINP